MDIDRQLYSLVQAILFRGAGTAGHDERLGKHFCHITSGLLSNIFNIVINKITISDHPISKGNAYEYIDPFKGCIIYKVASSTIKFDAVDT